jgi:hypothetical protein
MSAALAYPDVRPHQRPQLQPTQPGRRHVEIVTTKAQRAARPKSFYAVVAVAGVFALFLAQLLLSILLSDGAYQISSLQSQQRQLSRVEQDLTEQLDLLASPQSLAVRADSIGMVLGASAPVFLRLSDGSLSGPATPAGGAAGAGGGLVANYLLMNAPAVAADAASASSGAPSGTSASGSVASGSDSTQANSAAAGSAAGGGSLPSPNTR